MEAFLAELEHGSGDREALCAALPPEPAWTPSSIRRVHDVLQAVPPDVADFVRSLVPCVEDTRVEVGADGDTESDDDAAEVFQGVFAEAGDMRACLDADRKMAEAAGRERTAAGLEKEHLCHVAERYFAKSDRGTTGEERCEVWGACAAVADVLGMRLAQQLAGNGTQYKPGIQDAEDLARMLSTYGKVLVERGVRADMVPIRVAREGCWRTAEDRARSLRKVRMRVFQYVAETDAIVEAISRTLQLAETDPVTACARLDRRKRGRGGRIKLGTGDATDVDWAYAATVCPNNEDARRILAVLHNARVLSWTYVKATFPDTRVANDPMLLNTLCGFAKDNDRRRDVALRICEALEREVLTPQDPLWTAGVFEGRTGAVRRQLSRALESEDVPEVVLPVDPPDLGRSRASVPPTIPGKYVATIRRAEAAAPLLAPRIFHMVSPTETRVGRSVEDTVGQWRHMPVPIAYPARVAEALAQFATRRDSSCGIEEVLVKEALNMEYLPPNDSYDHVCPRAAPGCPYEHLPEAAKFSTHADLLLSACNPHPRVLIRHVLKQSHRGGRPRESRNGEESPPDVTPFLEELALSFMYWLHMFVETKRGWIAVPRTTDDEEPVHCFVIRSCDLSLAPFKTQPVFGAGGACCLSTAPPPGPVKYVHTRLALAEPPGSCAVDPHVAIVHGDGILHVFHRAGELPAEFGSLTTLSQTDMPSGWRPELARVNLKHCGALADFMIRTQVMAEFPGCVRGDVLELALPEAATVVRRAIFWTELMRTGGNTEVERLCRDFDIALKDALDLVRVPGDMSPGWREVRGGSAPYTPAPAAGLVCELS